MSLREIQEKRQKAYHAIDELRKKHSANGDKWPDAESEAAWKRVNDDYKAALAEEDEFRKAAEVGSRFKEIEEQNREADARGTNFDGRKPGQDDPRGKRTKRPDGESQAVALQGYLRSQQGLPLKRSHREAMERCGVNPGQRSLDVPLATTQAAKQIRSLLRNAPAGMMAEDRAEYVQRALGTTSASIGGALIPEGFVTQLEVNMLAYSGILQVADILRTDSGNDLPWPTADDTSNTGAILGESSDASTAADPSFSQVVFGAWKFWSKMVKVPTELLEDSAFDLASYLPAALGERLGRALNSKCTTGDGASEPNGVVTAATLGKTTASSTAITAGELIELFHSVDNAYRGNASWMMNDAIAMQVRLLKDGQSRYYWLDNPAGPFASTIMGRAVTINSAMDSAMTATKKVILFGDFSKYKIRLVRATRLKRLVERYADYDQEGYVAFLRADGNLLDAGTAPIKYLQMKA